MTTHSYLVPKLKKRYIYASLCVLMTCYRVNFVFFNFITVVLNKITKRNERARKIKFAL